MARATTYKEGYSKYNYSSNAYAYELAPKRYDYQEEEKRRERAEKARIKEEQERHQAAAHKFKLTVAVILVFFGCFAMMASYASVMQQRMVVNSLKDELAYIKNENISLQADISESVDLEYIKGEAIYRLGMTEPQPYQVVYIDIPKQSYNVQYASAEIVEDKGFTFEALLNLFNR